MASRTVETGALENVKVAKSHAERFRQAALRLTELTRRPDRSMEPYLDADLPLFSQQTLEKQVEIVRHLEEMVTISELTLARGASLNDSVEVVRTIFSHGGYSSVETIFEHLQADDYVDVYDCQTHELIFANNVLNILTSYTLEEMFCYPWTEIISRGAYGVFEQLYACVQETLQAQPPKLVFMTHVEDHVAHETYSRLRRSFIIFPRFVAPIFRIDPKTGAQEFSAYLCSNKVFPYDGAK